MAKVRMSFTVSDDCKKEIARGAELLGVSASEYVELCVADRLRSTEGLPLESVMCDTAMAQGWWRAKRARPHLEDASNTPPSPC